MKTLKTVGFYGVVILLVVLVLIILPTWQTIEKQRETQQYDTNITKLLLHSEDVKLEGMNSPRVYKVTSAGKTYLEVCSNQGCKLYIEVGAQ